MAALGLGRKVWLRLRRMLRVRVVRQLCMGTLMFILVALLVVFVVAVERPFQRRVQRLPTSTGAERPRSLPAVSHAIRMDPEHVLWLNARLREMTLGQFLRWVDATIPKSVLFTSFGPSGLVVLHELSKAGLLSRTPVVTIDTLYLFPETYRHIQRVETNYRFHAQRLRPLTEDGHELQAASSFEKEYGMELWQSDPERYAWLTKMEPTQRAMKVCAMFADCARTDETLEWQQLAFTLQDLDAFAQLTGMRRTQGGERKQVALLEVVGTRLRINPLAHWSLDEVWSYIRSSKISYNPLHDQGFASVGDWPTTGKTALGEAERSGRWKGSNRTECGMHSILSKLASAEQDSRPQEWESGARQRAAALSIVTITSLDAFAAELRDSIRLLIMFFSPLCGHCVEFEPKFNAMIALLHADQVLEGFRVLRVDVTDLDVTALPDPFEVSATPTLYITNTLQRVVGTNGVADGSHAYSWVMEKLRELGIQSAQD